MPGHVSARSMSKAERLSGRRCSYVAPRCRPKSPATRLAGKYMYIISTFKRGGEGEAGKKKMVHLNFREIVCPVCAMFSSFCIIKTRITLDFFVYTEREKKNAKLYLQLVPRWRVRTQEGTRTQKITSSMQGTSGAHIN